MILSVLKHPRWQCQKVLTSLKVTRGISPARLVGHHALKWLMNAICTAHRQTCFIWSATIAFQYISWCRQSIPRPLIGSHISLASTRWDSWHTANDKRGRRTSSCSAWSAASNICQFLSLSARSNRWTWSIGRRNLSSKSLLVGWCPVGSNELLQLSVALIHPEIVIWLSTDQPHKSVHSSEPP